MVQIWRNGMNKLGNSKDLAELQRAVLIPGPTKIEITS